MYNGHKRSIIYIYIYIYMCVCVCVGVKEKAVVMATLIQEVTQVAELEKEALTSNLSSLVGILYLNKSKRSFS